MTGKSRGEEEKLKNRAALRLIVETVLFCARQELPMRGDANSGPLTIEEPKQRDGKSRALLRFRADSGDLDLRNHIVNCKKNATMTSPEIQNKIIAVKAQIVRQKLINNVQNSKYFSIFADETADNFSVEQLSLCARYVTFESNKPILHEDFLCFVPIFDQRANNITSLYFQKRVKNLV